MSDKTEVKKVLEKVDKWKAFVGKEKMKSTRLALKISQISAFGKVYEENISLIL